LPVGPQQDFGTELAIMKKASSNVLPGEFTPDPITDLRTETFAPTDLARECEIMMMNVDLKKTKIGSELSKISEDGSESLDEPQRLADSFLNKDERANMRSSIHACNPNVFSGTIISSGESHLPPVSLDNLSEVPNSHEDILRKLNYQEVPETGLLKIIKEKITQIV